MDVSQLPALNAALNGSCALLLAAGFVSIKKKNIALHNILMRAAFAVSVLFLISYLIYHYQAGSTKFQGQGWIRPVYFSILLSHTILATLIVPLVLRTIYLALRQRFEDHRRWARWTWPLWMYVSVTGVTIYWMLYQLRWPTP
jgi:uncharacterized membrane protein YozB (DUF420 family)